MELVVIGLITLGLYGPGARFTVFDRRLQFDMNAGALARING